ncbi:MAG: hypothetical protein ACJAVO_002481 [Parvibaculaceae bacterium]|jgi:hypothetical protein
MTDFGIIYLIGMAGAMAAFSATLAYCSIIAPNRDGIDPR